MSKRKNRRDFLSVGATAVLGLSALGVGAGCVTQAEPIIPDDSSLNQDKLDMLLGDPDLCERWVASARELANKLNQDDVLRERFLTNTESVRLVRLYNDHRGAFEPLFGKVDGRNREGRMLKMVVSAEMFDNVAGFDFAYEGVDYEDEVGCCSFLIGCCTLHFWNDNYYAANNCGHNSW
jgi:hypothetical protein